MSETFLIGEQELDVAGFTWFGNNRKSLSKRACRGSGGVGILVRNNVLTNYDIAVLSNKFEGILFVQLIHKTSRKSIGICVCYLPPASSSRGDHSQDFFDSLKSIVIENYHIENFLICGDLNARCGNAQEASVLHFIPKRTSVDTVINQVGKELLSTLDTLDMCMLNGRFSPSWDSYTSVSTNGMSVVDYILVPTKSFNSFKNFRVQDPLHIINEHGIAIDSSIPDHRILTAELVGGPLRYDRKPSMPKKVNIKTVPADFMNDASPVQELEGIVNQLELDKTNISLDEVYKNFCEIIDSQLLSKQVNKGRSTSYSKPWWNEDLGALAKEVRLALKQWEKHRGNSQLKLSYLTKQKQFNKLVRSSKRKFRRLRRDKLLEDQKRNPKAFWNFIKNLGGSEQASLPDSVIDEMGNEQGDPGEVKETWKKYFQSLLNPPSNKSQLDIAIEPDRIMNNLDPVDLNDEISMQEVETAILSNNDHKSPGVDGIRPTFIKNQAEY